MSCFTWLVFNISCCLALPSQIKSVLVHSVLLRSTNMELNELPLLCDLSCQYGSGKVPPQNIPQHFPLTAHHPACARTMTVPQDTAPANSSLCQHRPATVPALLDTAALGGQFSRAVGPTDSLLPRKTQWVYPLFLSPPQQPLSKALGWTLWEQPWCWAGSTESPGSAASNGKPTLSEADM